MVHHFCVATWQPDNTWLGNRDPLREWSTCAVYLNKDVLAVPLHQRIEL